jgi:signal peptidase I
MNKFSNIKKDKFLLALKFQKELEVITKGNSMFPFFIPNTKILIKKLKDINTLRRNDIILFYNSKKGSIIAHRIKTTSEKIIITKGDNCKNNDTSILFQEDIIAFVIGFMKGNRLIKRNSFSWNILSFYSVNIPKIKLFLRTQYHALYYFINKKL